MLPLFSIKSLFVPVALSLLAILAPFFFPWPVALTIALIAALFVPPIAIVNGGLIDMLYFSAPHSSHVIPYFTLTGILIAIIAAFVQQFVKTRIMS